MGDPIGLAIKEYSKNNNQENIQVFCDISEEDLIPVDYLFRSYEDMPDIEKFALSQASGKVLDIGAAAGCHAKHLISEGIDVTTVEKSDGACDYLRENNIKVYEGDILTYSEGQFDTILLLMNGIGIAGTIEKLPVFLTHLKNLLKPGGKILCDSSNIDYMYQNEDGSMWIDLNSNYYGELKYNMQYKSEETGWFDWLFIDQERLGRIADSCGLIVDIILEGTNGHYLAELKLK